MRQLLGFVFKAVRFQNPIFFLERVKKPYSPHPTCPECREEYEALMKTLRVGQ
jgi:hypothetical protein